MVELEKGPDTLRPADVLDHGIDNSPLAVDFSVVHPLQPSANFAEVRPESWLARLRIRRCVRGSPHVVVWDGPFVLSFSKPPVPGAARPST